MAESSMQTPLQVIQLNPLSLTTEEVARMLYSLMLNHGNP